MKRILFYCQHVLGMGHLVRSAELVRGLVQAGFDVSFLNGGELAPGFELPAGIHVTNLPPIKADAEFRDIQAAGDSRQDDAQEFETLKAKRVAIILAEYERFQPDALIVELFPFGRRKFAFELMPLLERIQVTGRRTKVACSLRDILVSKRDQTRFESQVVESANRYFDLLLIHADPNFQRLEETFPSTAQLTCDIRYTGFVCTGTRASTPALFPKVDNDFARDTSVAKAGVDARVPVFIVSIGGGRVGYELLESAAQASALLADELPHRMQIFTGPYLPDEQFNELKALTQHNGFITVERFTNDFPERLAEADLSISMAGYNTCMNVLTANIPALVLPFTGNNNEEQSLRARKLAALGVLEVISDLAPAALARQMRAALQKNRAAKTSLRLDGAAQTAAIVTEWLSAEARAAKGRA